MRVLVACEFSGIVRDAFRSRGHDAWSCDLVDTERDPRYHIQTDVLRVLLRERFDLMIAHPPCTYLSTCGNRHAHTEEWKAERERAWHFVAVLWEYGPSLTCIENPQGYLNTIWRKPDQTIHPWYFGDARMKRTCLWLKNLPPLQYDLSQYEKPLPDYYTPDGYPKYWTHKTKDHSKGTCGKERSVTSWAIAEAMAEQWGGILEKAA